jgi:hypothetical protein
MDASQSRSLADYSSTVPRGKMRAQRFGFLDLIYVIRRKGVVVVEQWRMVEAR